METAYITPKQATQYLVGIGYSQQRISRESGVPQGTVSRILTGKHKDPRLSTAQALLALTLRAKTTTREMQVSDVVDKAENRTDTVSDQPITIVTSPVTTRNRDTNPAADFSTPPSAGAY